MSLSSQFKTDKKAEIDGIKVEYAANEDGSIPTFYIRRMSRSNLKYTKSLEARTRPFRRLIENDQLDPKLAEKINIDIFLDSVLVHFENVPASDVTGKKDETGFASYTKENARLLFENLPDLYDDLQTKAQKASMFKEGVLEDEAENL